jgi:hypothetical protein
MKGVLDKIRRVKKGTCTCGNKAKFSADRKDVVMGRRRYCIHCFQFFSNISFERR